MAVYVLVHGSHGGGWMWREMAALISGAGHEVYRPTLTGLGDRVHLASPEIGLDTHIQDLVNLLFYEDLHEVILVGFSYSGMVVTGVAEQIPERIGHLVYLDAYIPRDGESIHDMVEPAEVARRSDIVRTSGDGWYIPAMTNNPRVANQPFKPYTQPLRIGNPLAAALPRTYINCIRGKTDEQIEQGEARAAGCRIWRIDTTHAGWLFNAQELQEMAQLLLDIAK